MKFSKPYKVCEQNFQKTPQGLSTIFQKQGFHDFLEKSNQIFREFQHLSQKNRQGFLIKFSKPDKVCEQNFQKNPTRFVNNFSKQGFHDFLKKSNKIFRKFQHLFQKSRKILQDLQTSLRKRMLNNFTQFPQKPNKIFIKSPKDMTRSFQEYPTCFQKYQF